MHREYHPEDAHRLHAHSHGAGVDGPAHDHSSHHTSIYVLTTAVGLLIGADLLLSWVGRDDLARPMGVSLSLVAAILGGSRIVYIAFEALLAGRIGADFVLAQACIAAIVLGRPFVAAEVVFIALVGEVLEAITFERAQSAIRDLLARAPSTARVRRDGAELEIPAEQVLVGDTLLVRPGDRIAADGRVSSGKSTVDQSSLTGESMPVPRGLGDPVFSGTMNQLGALEVEVEKTGQATALGQVVKLVGEFQKRKAPIERLADRLARYFLPIVEGAAALTLLAGWLLHWPDVWSRAVAILVVACPCALVLATPAAVLAASARLARKGAISKGGVSIERLARCNVFAFDKTGTLTKGEPKIVSITTFSDLNAEQVLALAASAEQSIDHPLAKSVLAAARERGLPVEKAYETAAEPGLGVRAKLPNQSHEETTILVGGKAFVEEHGVELDDEIREGLEALDHRGETPLLVAKGNRLVGLLGAIDFARDEAHDVIHDLKHLGIGEFAILTGDREAPARIVAKRVHIKTVVAELLPVDKAKWIEERQGEGKRVAMVGDGVNDAPALARADAGIAIAKLGANLAAEAGDFVLLGDPLAVLPEMVEISRGMTSIIRQNIIIFAIGLNAVAMAAAALGILGPVAAAILHQAGSLLVLLNAMRLLVKGRIRETAPFRLFEQVRSAVRSIDDRIDPGFVGSRILGRWKSLLAAGMVMAVALYATSGWRAIRPDEVGLLKRQGRFAGVLQPGLHLRLPWPLETVTLFEPDRLRSARVGFPGYPERTSAGGSLRWEATHAASLAERSDESALAMTGDSKLVEATLVAHYRVGTDPSALRAHLFETEDAQGAIERIAASVVRREIARRPLEDLLSRRRTEVETAIALELQRRIDACGVGGLVVGVAFQDVHPPLAVVDSYREVTRAENSFKTRTIEAETYRAEKGLGAGAEAIEIRQRAESDRESRQLESRAKAESFGLLSNARYSQPALDDLRLYWETISQSLAGKGKIVLDGRANPALAPRRLFWPEAPSLPQTTVDDSRQTPTTKN